MQTKVPTPEKGTHKIDPEKFRIEISKSGPYLVYGTPPINCYTIEYDAQGNPWNYDIGTKNYALPKEPTALCRCGLTKASPYCDGSHIKAVENGEVNLELTSSHNNPLDNAVLYEGPVVSLTDVEELCAFARFCDAKGRTWTQIERSDEPEQAALAIRTASSCPAGRLKAWSNDEYGIGEAGSVHEPQYKPQIGLIEDPAVGASGPLFIMGGIPIFDDEKRAYQPRNRVTLCRCGRSENKPFCDGTHVPAHYRDHLKKE